METQCVHVLKSDPEIFDHVKEGKKNFEVRLNDRNYQVGDWIRFNKYDNGRITDGCGLYAITYILHGGKYGIKKGYCVLEIKAI